MRKNGSNSLGGSLCHPARFEKCADRSAANKIGRVIFGYNDNYVASAPVGTYDANQRDSTTSGEMLPNGCMISMRFPAMNL